MTKVIMRDKHDNILWEGKYASINDVEVVGDWLKVYFPGIGETQYTRISKDVIVVSFVYD